MIYLVFTASLHNRYGATTVAQETRLQRYLYAIRHTLQHLPSSGEIRPVIVENNGARSTALDDFTWMCEGKEEPVPVVYTTHNEFTFRNKGVNEWMDIQAALRALGVLPTDHVIKVTGRYRVMDSRFFDWVRSSPHTDAFFAPFNVHTHQWDDDDCVLGMFALRAFYFYTLHPSALDLYESAEKGVVRYLRRTVSSRWEMPDTWGGLGLECVFADDKEQRLVRV